MTGQKGIFAKTASGDIEGLRENGQIVFKGIPYAAPPVGPLRWLPPQPVGSWEGIRPAYEFGAIAPQNPMPGGTMPAFLSIDEPQDEDCLYLNVWTPGIDNARRPVMVWIHGGAFIIGSGSQNMVRGNTLVPNGNIVLVTINYRLGALGFLHLKEITGGGIPATGCEGLLDQVAALRWVQANIRNFGGDPENITVFGESAGGMSIGCLMSMPAARGTFQKCILQSGAANTVASLEEGTSAAREFLDVLKLNPDSVDTLRSLSADRLMAAQEKLGAVMLSRDNRITPFQPVVDGTEMPDIPIQAIQKGFASGIATLIGTNLDEFKLFVAMDPGYRNMDEDSMIRRLCALIPLEYVPKVTDAYRKAREKRGEPVQPGEILTAIQTDLMFRIPAIHLATAQRDNGCPAYTYLFSRKSPVLGGALGACHALEIGFVFGNYDKSFCGTGPEVETLSRKMQDAWTAFARTGNPSCASLGEWKGYGSAQTTMILDTRCRMEDAPYNEEKSVWDGLGLLFTKPI